MHPDLVARSFLYLVLEKTVFTRGCVGLMQEERALMKLGGLGGYPSDSCTLCCGWHLHPDSFNVQS